MARYIIVYLGGDQPATPEEGKRHFSKYKEWLNSLGDAIISPANPFKDTQTVKPDGSASAGSSTAMSGYTIIKAESLDKAVAIAKECPFLDINGTLEVSELVEM